MAHKLRVTLLCLTITLVCGAAGLAQPEAGERPVSPQEAAFLDAPPRIGEPAPDFNLRTPNGDEVSLSDLYAEKPVVLEFGSMTCPIYRNKIERMNRLREQFGDAAAWVLVYTIEAHPCDVPDPYTGRIWPHERNEAEGLLIEQPTDYEGRIALVRRTIDEFGEHRQILVDGMDNATWEAWGRRPNSAFVIDRGGEIVEKQFWANPNRLRATLAQLTGDPRRGDRDRQREVRPPMPIPNPQVQYRDGAWVMTDLQYGEVDGYPLLLDAYLPDNDEVNPALIFIHGGGWRGGSKAGGFNAVRGNLLIPRGVAVFSLSYRLSGVAPYPAAVEDCLAAVRWIRANADEFRIDPDNIAAWGGSAGGHLALMMGFLRPGPDDLDADGELLKSFMRCVVALNPPTDFMADDEMHNESALVAFMAAPRDQAPDSDREGSPVTHLTPDAPPVYVMHGTADRTVPYNQALVLQEAMAQVGVEMELVTFEGAGHGLRNADPEEREAAMLGAVEFVLGHLGR